MRFAAFLEDGREELLAALRPYSEERAAERPGEGRWSVLECVEHIVAVEERHLRWLERARAIEPRRDDDRALRLFTTIRNRFDRVEAPEVLKPKGRFATLDEARTAFISVRARVVALVRERGEDLYALGAHHPFFGSVNGVELVQLIDGHARRHTEQILTLWDEPVVAPPPVEPTRAPRPEDAPRAAAVIPAVLTPIEQLASPPEESLRNARLSGLHWIGAQAAVFEAEGCVLERLRLGEASFGSIRWKDVRVIGCDLANLHARRLCLERVEFIDCRLTGLAADDHDWQDVLVRNADGRYANLQRGRFRNCEFADVQWQEADLREAELRGCVVRNCRLERADLRGAALAGVDFRGSQVEEMLVGVTDLRGAIVDPAQAVVLSLVLGLRIG